MQDIAKFTKMDVPTRVNRLMTFRQRLGQSRDILETFNMELAPELVKVTARELNQEKILFGNQIAYQNTAKVNWTNELMKNRFYTQVNLENWIVIYPSKFEGTVNNFLDVMRKLANSLDYVIKKPEFKPLNSDSKDAYVKALNTIVEGDDDKIDMIMFILPNNDTDRYKAIKKRCCVDRALLSQVVTIRNITPKAGKENQLRSVASKILIQMNAKMGGIPWNFNCPIKGKKYADFKKNSID